MCLDTSFLLYFCFSVHRVDWEVTRCLDTADLNVCCSVAWVADSCMLLSCMGGSKKLVPSIAHHAPLVGTHDMALAHLPAGCWTVHVNNE